MRAVTTAILDYEAGNVTSVARVLRHAGGSPEITADPERIARADRVVFPGVGAAASCMRALRSRGVDQALRAALARGTPVLGICLGLQLLFEHSDEDGGTPCLGVLPGRVRRFAPAPGLKIPHMGWNPVAWSPDEPLAADVPAGAAFYFVHSYFVDPGDGVAVIATSDHGGRFCAGVRRGNLAAVQFHPEKSGTAGLALLRAFLRM